MGHGTRRCALWPRRWKRNHERRVDQRIAANNEGGTEMKAMEEITQLLQHPSRASFDRVFDLMYQEIRQVAKHQLYKLNPGQTLSPTVLINECYLKLSQYNQLSCDSRTHFVCTVARCMRQFLVDNIRYKSRAKRDGQVNGLPLTQFIGDEDVDHQLLDLDEALMTLEKIDATLSQLVELRFFSGHTMEEIADVRGKSKRQNIRDWHTARSMLSAILSEHSA